MDDWGLRGLIPSKGRYFRHSQRRDRLLGPFRLVGNKYREFFQMDVHLMIKDLNRIWRMRGTVRPLVEYSCTA